MLHNRLDEFRQNAQVIQARANQRVQTQFEPLRNELLFHLALNQERLSCSQRAFSRSKCSSAYDEPPIGRMLTNLLEAHIHTIHQALSGHSIKRTCSTGRTFVIRDRDLVGLCGTSELTEAEVAGLATSCAEEYMSVFQLSDVTFTADSSMIGEEFYLDAWMYVFS